LCAADSSDEIDVIVKPTTRSVLEVDERLTRDSPAFPGIRPGRLVESDTFQES
jgi:hypothetical protein